MCFYWICFWTRIFLFRALIKIHGIGNGCGSSLSPLIQLFIVVLTAKVHPDAKD